LLHLLVALNSQAQRVCLASPKDHLEQLLYPTTQFFCEASELPDFLDSKHLNSLHTRSLFAFQTHRISPSKQKPHCWNFNFF
jgi:hypothetical protein